MFNIKLIIIYIFISNYIYSSLSFQGFSGVINTPNSDVIRDGDGVIHYNNQLDNHILKYDKNRIKTYKEQTYNFGIGFLNNFEFIGRLTNIEKKNNRDSKSFVIRDLSANIKFRLPFHHKYLPNIAFGIQDFGGAANSYDNKYIVLDKNIFIFKPSIGYGKASGEGKSSRMNGFFGALEIKPFTWFDILFEYDGKEKHSGLRLNIPNSFISNLNINGLFSYNLNTKSNSFALNLVLPLFHKSKKLNNLDKIYMKNIENKVKQNLKIKSIEQFQKILIDFGFENVRIGKINKTLYLEYENGVFSQNTIDSFGYILGKITNLDLGFTNYKLVLLKNNLKIFSISGNIKLYKNYILNDSSINLEKLQKNIKFSKSFDKNITFLTKKENSSFFIPRLKISPDVASAVGTEIGVFDYHLVSQFELYTNIYDGITASILYKIPVSSSENFKKGKAFYSKLREKKRFVRIMLNQTFNYKNLINTISVGKYGKNQAVINNLNITSLNGAHSANIRYGGFESELSKKKSSLLLYSYQYNYSKLNLYGKITYGEYWRFDKGTTVEIKRFFGEASVSFIYQDVKFKSNHRERYAGISFSIPLTFRKVIKSYKFGQLLGTNNFSYGLRSTILRKDGTNTLNANGGIIPMTNVEIPVEYLNKDRLSSNYILNNLDRMRESYIKYSN